MRLAMEPTSREASGFNVDLEKERSRCVELLKVSEGKRYELKIVGVDRVQWYLEPCLEF